MTNLKKVIRMIELPAGTVLYQPKTAQYTKYFKTVTTERYEYCYGDASLSNGLLIEGERYYVHERAASYEFFFEQAP